ncbi:MAG: hypothetical protein LJF15_06690 [Acidobacteria bacterium]|nr:hypothetical protein [Acidobacteriota bacterium]
MTVWSRWTAIALATLVAVSLSPVLWASEEHAGPPAAETRETPRPPSKTPIADSVDRIVERLIRERYSPCEAQGSVPCFPVTVEVQGRQYSVRETMERYEFDSRPVPGTPPTAEEMIQHGANPRPTSASVSFDPKAIVCKTKQLLRTIQGKSRKYYLYRLWDHTGERAVLRDRPLDPETLAGSPRVLYVPLGEFGDECEAMKAYLTATHEVRIRREAAEAERGETPTLELRSDGPPE